MNKEFLAKKKEINELKTNKADKADLSILEDNINALKTDVNSLKSVDTSLGKRIDNVDSKASAAKIKAEEGVAKADDALTKANSNTTDINSLQTDVNALKSVDTSLGKRIDNVDSKASAAKTKAEEGVTKADNALTATRTNATNINTLKTDVNSLKTNVKALDATDERIWTNLDIINRTASIAKTKAEEGVAKADDALARNIFTDEEKAKLANITNPMIIKGRVDTVNDLPTEAVTGWFYFVGLESASSYEEYCYSENGWEYIGLSQEGVDLSNYYTKKQVDTTINELKAIDNSLGTRIDNVDSKASAAKIKAEEGVAKADNALTKASSNTTNINSLQTDVRALETNVKALKATDESIWTNLDTINKTASAAKLKAEEGVAKADDALTATRTNAANISTHETRLDSIDNTLSSHDTRITTAQQKANSVDEKVDSTNEVVGQLSTSLQSAYNKINAHANDIAINRTTLGTQCKNLLKNTAVTTTKSGVTFTVNNDKSITVSGTATNRIIFLVGTVYISQTRNYTYTGTPSGGASSTYSMNYRNSNVYKDVETGNGITTQFEGGKTYEAVIDIRSGVTISNLTFSPMLRDADITDDTYEPYKENIDERLINNTSDIAISRTTIGYQCKNLLKNTAATKTFSGVTFTVNSDGSVTVNGTNTSSSAAVYIELCGFKNYGTGKLTASLNSTDSNLYMSVFDKNWVGIGSVCDKEITWDNNNKERLVRLVVRPGATINNVTVYPMIRYADINDDTYEPYRENVAERLINNTSDIAVNKTTLGYQCKNLLKNTASTKTVSGITFTVNDDKSVTANGTNSTSNYANIIVFKGELEAGTYILTGAISDAFRIRLGMGTSTDGYGSYVGVDNGNGYTFTVTEKALYTVTCQIASGKTASNVIFKPMIRDAEITDDTYEPYQPSLIDRCLLKDTSGEWLGHAQSSSITIDNLSSYTALWVNVSGNVSGINFQTNLIVPVAYLAKSTSKSVQLAGGIPSSAYIASGGPIAAKDMNGTITAKVSGNTLDLTISDGVIGGIEVISLM